MKSAKNMAEDKIRILIPLGKAQRSNGGVNAALNVIKNMDMSRFHVMCCHLGNPDESIIKELNKIGVTIFSLNADSIRGLSRISEIYKIAKAEDIDIIHIHGRGILNVGLGLMKLLNRKSLILITTQQSSHGKSSNFTFKAKILSAISNLLSDSVTCVSKSVWESLPWYEKLACRGKIIRVIYNSINTSELYEKTLNVNIEEKKLEFNIESDYYVIGTVANLEPRKGHDLLIKALQIVSRHIPKVKLLIVGGIISEEYMAYLNNLSQELSLSEQIIFTGKRNDVYEILSIIDVFVLSTKSEGFCVALIEAMAAGKAIIASDIGPTKEAIEHQLNGLLIPREPEVIANAIISLLNNPQKRKNMGESARRKTDICFSAEKISKEYEELYIRLMNVKDERYNFG